MGDKAYSLVIITVIFTQEAPLTRNGFHGVPASDQIGIYRCWFFLGEWKTGEPEKNLSEQSR